MSLRVLFVASVVLHIKAFHLPYLEMLKNNGYEVHVAAYSENANEEIPYCDKFHNVEFNRNPFSIKTISSYIALKRVIKNGSFNIIHCHTPVASVLARIAARKCKNTTMIYTAHGFHFFKGAPLMNWMIYYPVEKFCARYTDKLITINKEDFDRAKKFKLRNNGESYYIPGVGLDLGKINAINVDRETKRKELGVPIDAFLIVSVGELNKNKNHKVVIEALGKINNQQMHYVICGQGVLKDYLEDLIKKHGLENQVHLLGYRRDIIEVNKCADLFAFPSKREGLPVSIMEAMACGLPIVCSDIRGNEDLIKNSKNGYLVENNFSIDWAHSIDFLYKNPFSKEYINIFNQIQLAQYDWNTIKNVFYKIYFS